MNLAGDKPMRREPDAAPRSVLRLLGLFEVLARAEDGLALAELNAALSVPKSSLLMLLRPLTGNGYLVHSEGRYRLGPRIFQLASEIVAGRRFSTIIRPFMEELVARTAETVALSVFDREAQVATFAEVVEGPQDVRYNVPVGRALPLYCSSGGRLFLAYEERAWLEDYLKSVKLKAVTRLTITDKTELRRILDRVRASGISVSVGESALEAAGISAPVFDADGKVLAALVIGAPSDRFERERPMLERHLVEVAAAASAAMGFRAPAVTATGKARKTAG